MKTAAACVLLAAAATAWAADPYPDQRGELASSELAAATAAMRAMPRADAKLPLYASGRRANVAYAVFGGPGEQAAPVLYVQNRVLCTAPESRWTCAPQIFYRFMQGKLVQSFAYSTRGMAEDPQMPFRIVVWAGRCLGPQYAEKIGGPPPAGMPQLAEVVQDAKRVVVITASGDTYELTEPAAAPGQTCPFELQSARVGASALASAGLRGQDTTAPERVEAAPPLLEGPAAAPVLVSRHPALVWVVRAAILFCALAGIAALVLPFAVRRVRGRRAAATVSTLLTAAAVAGAIASLVAIRFAGNPGAARSLSFLLPLTAVAIASCVVWTVIGILAARPKPKKA